MKRLPSQRLPPGKSLSPSSANAAAKSARVRLRAPSAPRTSDRAALNRMLRELADEGQLDRQRKRLHHAGTLPPVVVADITGRDSDGELLARPTEWDEEAHGAPPVIHITTPRRASPGEIAGVGDRALIRIDAASERGNERPRHKAHRSRQTSHARCFSRAAQRRRQARADRQETARPRTCDRTGRNGGRRRRRSGRRRGGAAWPTWPADRLRSSNGSARSRASAPSA